MKWLNHLFSIIINQLSRRIFVMLLYTALIGTIILWSMREQPFNDGVMQWITLFAVIVILVSGVGLELATRGNAKRNTLFVKRKLDERQEELRNQAYFKGYHLLGSALFLLYLVNNEIGLGYTFLSAFAFYLTIPTAVIAWLEPDPIQNDDFKVRVSNESSPKSQRAKKESLNSSANR